MLVLSRLLIAVMIFGPLGHPHPDGRDTASLSQPAKATVVVPLGLQVEAPDEGWARLVEWAEDRFAVAGLSLPPGAVSIRPGHAEHCAGSSGLYRPGPMPEVRICVDRPADSKVSRLIVLHELAHLWAESRLAAGTAEAFLAIRNLDVWQDPDRPPHEWGAEHAAEVLSWGLIGEPVRIVRIRDAEPEQLWEAFVLLTGSDPLVGSG